MGFENEIDHHLQKNRQPSLKDPPFHSIKERLVSGLLELLYEEVSPDVLYIYDEDFIRNKRKEERIRKSLLLATGIMMGMLLWEALS
ncbi:MAG: hypothetical protein AAFO69_02100 [Bacteroidota bacterium]